MSYSNQLINETSPYLLQHAHNPVQWYPWSDEALDRAKTENKPILVSIGYAACHWCHVMERESFENESTAAYMNEHFVNIKIDREERPDLDHIYMDAVQAMTGSGGWPLNVFLTPGAKPFYGGTYFPPVRAYNRPSWLETLQGVSEAFTKRRHEIDAQAENLTDHLLKSNSFGIQESQGDEVFTKDNTAEAFQNIIKQADKEWGGFGKAPKFPQTFSIQYLLRYYYSTGNKEALEQACLSLDKMIEGGIYDQAGGGFARYSTDTEWLAPHFEKMLYDNALLVAVLSEAFQLTKKERYREVIVETMTFIQRELLHEGHAFYSALDADSEGVEGKFYVWELEELNSLLGKDAAVFCDYYDISAGGNWHEPVSTNEKKNILRVKKPFEQFAEEKQIDRAELKRILEKGKDKLMQKRSERIRPLLDDKVILGWNALMNTATSKAYAATGKKEYLDLCIANMNFLLKNFRVDGHWHHTWKNGKAKYPAFLDDLAFMTDALIHLQELTGDRRWLVKAKEIATHVQENYKEDGTPFFFYTAAGQKDVIIRKKEVYDGAVPSGNSVMAYSLYRLGILFEAKENVAGWKEQGLEMVGALGGVISRYPTSFGNWACLLLEIVEGTSEIAILGSDFEKGLRETLAEYIPHRVLMGAEKAEQEFPLLAGKDSDQSLSLWLCRNYACQLPVFSAKELITLINRPQKPN